MSHARITLEEIINNMIKYRGKPADEPLTPAEAMLCMISYFKGIKEQL